MRALGLSLAILAALTLPAHAELTLEKAVANPDWIGPPVTAAFWGLDGKALYYQTPRANPAINDLEVHFQIRRPSRALSDTHRIGLADGVDQLLAPGDFTDADGPDPVYDRAQARAAFVRNGDLFIRDLSSHRLTQITRLPAPPPPTDPTYRFTDSPRPPARIFSPQFSPDGRRLFYRVSGNWYAYDIAASVSGPAAILRTEDDPAKEKLNALQQEQLELFSTLRAAKAYREGWSAAEADAAAGDPSRAPLPIYVGAAIRILDSTLSPDGRWLLLTTVPRDYDPGRLGKQLRLVTESGYEQEETTHTRVGRNRPAPQALLLVDLAQRRVQPISFDKLPGLFDDPLLSVRIENAKAQSRAYEPPAAKTAREVLVSAVSWRPDGGLAAVQLRAIDNKDRWIAVIDPVDAVLRNQHRLSDPAAVSREFNEFGWLSDGQSLWYLSEQSGYSQLYKKVLGGAETALTRGSFEVSQPVLSVDGNWFYFRANREAPYAYDLYRVPAAGGAVQQITNSKGLDYFQLSPDGTQVALLHSGLYLPPQLAVVGSAGGAVRELTDTRTAEYKAFKGNVPAIVQIPSSHVARAIHAKLYKPADFDPSKRYPAVVFVHSSGFQNTRLGYPPHFREQLFHNFLAEHGYVVIDVDGRSTAGYGRDWRTGTYRDRTIEVQDMVDAAHWLARTQSVDPKRIGIYGGSHGGYMTLLALFMAPEVFSAGAALRPVVDWNFYVQETVAPVLNEPQTDPIAYKRSSPIQLAANLKSPLLITHGAIDDNVLFEDTLRLVQRLIELRKDNFELAIYPLERHDFVYGDAWLDQYKRVFKLFQAHLANPEKAP